ncbi:MAG: T9SS type A sorting domain-containing protein [Bacteroidota bacterium]
MKKTVLSIIACICISITLVAQPKPVANFSGSSTTICAGQSVTWTNSSTNATTYAWTFSGGTPGTSTSVNPGPTTYNTPGVYSVTLIASNFTGGKDTLERVNYITVLATPTITVTPSSGSICSGGSVSLTATGANTYTWSPGTGLNTTTGATVIASPTVSTTYTVTSDVINGCAGKTTVPVAVGSGPPATPGTITGSISVCNGQTGVTYSIGSVANASSYSWTVPAGASVTSGQGTTSITVTYGSTSGNVCVTASNGCGTSTASCKAITVDPTASVDTVGTITGPKAVCANQSGVVYSISAVANASTYNWTVPTGSTITAGQGTPSVTVTFGNFPGNVCVTASNNCNTSPQKCFAVSISQNAPAMPGTITGSATVCNGQTGVTYSITSVFSATSYTWTVPAGASITAGQGTTSITVSYGSTSGNVCVTASNACGTSLPQCLAITVNSASPVDTVGAIAGPKAVCANQSGVIYSISAVANASTYNWTAPAGASITAGQGTTSITVTFANFPGNVCVTASNSCNTSPQKCIAVSISPSAPSIPGTITGPATVCNGQAGVTYSISSVVNATSYTWTVPTGASITTGQGTTSITVTHGSTSGDVCVTASNACGTSLPKCLTVTVSPSSPVDTIVTITGPTAVCASQSGVVYSISAVANASTYTWAVPAGASITAGQGTTSITVTFATSGGNVCVTVSNNCSTSPQKCLAVSISPNAPPIPGTITGSSAVCNGQAGVTYSISSVMNASSYTWTVPTGASITAGQGTTSVTVTYGSTSGDVCVTASNACGTSLPKCLTVTVNPTAGVDTVGAITGPTAICASQSGVVYSISAVVNASTYAWTVPAGASITAGQGTTSITVTFAAAGGNVCVTASNSCNTSPQKCVAVTISSTAPAIPGTITGPTTTCDGKTGVIYSISAVANATSYSWTVPTGASITTGQGTTSVNVTYGGTSGDVCVSASNGCGTSLPKCVTVTVNPVPVVNVTPSSPAICSGSGGSVSLTAGGATTYAWSPAIGLSATTGATVTASPTSTTTYTVTGTAGGCTDTATVIVTVSVCTGIVSINNPDIIIYPNPAQDFLFIEGALSSSERLEISIVNILGQTIIKKQLDVNNKFSERVNVESLQAGVYFVEISSGQSITKNKFVKQ